jgi:serine/threonine protein kinase
MSKLVSAEKAAVQPSLNNNPSNNDLSNKENNNNGYNTKENTENLSRSRYKTFILSNGVFEVENRYEIREVIGSGAYGVVCSALDLKTNQLVAIKKIENVFDHRSLAKRTLRELKLVRSFEHENILHLDRVMRPHNSANYSNVYMISELMETDLACVIRSPQELTDEHCQFFIYQVLRGLKYIHSAGVIHRDLKPRNLLVNSNCDLKICDFGLARLDDPQNNDRAQMSTYIATRWYRAPEVILGRKRYTKAVDMVNQCTIIGWELHMTNLFTNLPLSPYYILLSLPLF